MKEEVLLPSLQIRRVLINPSKRDKEFASTKHVTYTFLTCYTLRKMFSRRFNNSLFQ